MNEFVLCFGVAIHTDKDKEGQGRTRIEDDGGGGWSQILKGSGGSRKCRLNGLFPNCQTATPSPFAVHLEDVRSRQSAVDGQ
jgi:hypothetical protein